MPAELLSISIPTRNRSHLLRDLLTSLAAGINDARLTPEDIRIYVSDNASTDATRAVAYEIMGGLPHFTYWCNEHNLGGEGNIFHCVSKASGRYIWIIGDDECVPINTLPYLLSRLREHEPGWFIHSDGKYGAHLNPPRTFSSLGEFLQLASDHEPGLLITAGTISLNTFRADCWDYKLGTSLLGQTSYPHFFALMNGLRQNGAKVFLTERETVVFREQRPPPVDGVLPADSDANWQRCMLWLKEECGLANLDPEINSKLVSKEWLRQLAQNPWKAFRNNASLFLIPATYPRIIKRLWYAIKR